MSPRLPSVPSTPEVFTPSMHRRAFLRSAAAGTVVVAFGGSVRGETGHRSEYGNTTRKILASYVARSGQ